MTSNRKGNHKQLVSCGNCKKSFLVSHYRLFMNKKYPLACSYNCGAILRAEEVAERFSLSDSAVEAIRSEYLNSTKSIQKISTELGVARGTIFRYIKLNKWKRLTRPNKIRTIYRKNASLKLGRALFKYEQVHHIDLDTTNNECHNLHVYPTAKEHSRAHKSLERCAVHFLRKGLIVFNNSSGLYEIVT